MIRSRPQFTWTRAALLPGSDPAYVVNTGSGPQCEAGRAGLTEDECRAAATPLGSPFLAASANAVFPEGCFQSCNTLGACNLVFNTDWTGGSKEGYHVVCAPAPTPAPTPFVFDGCPGSCPPGTSPPDPNVLVHNLPTQGGDVRPVSFTSGADTELQGAARVAE